MRIAFESRFGTFPRCPRRISQRVDELIATFRLKSPRKTRAEARFVLNIQRSFSAVLGKVRKGSTPGTRMPNYAIAPTVARHKDAFNRLYRSRLPLAPARFAAASADFSQRSKICRA